MLQSRTAAAPPVIKSRISRLFRNSLKKSSENRKLLDLPMYIRIYGYSVSRGGSSDYTSIADGSGVSSGNCRGHYTVSNCIVPCPIPDPSAAPR